MHELEYVSIWTTKQIILDITREKDSDAIRQELFLNLTAYIYW